MSAKEFLQKIGETLGSTATVKSVFGDPIHMENKTVVPVAKVSYGFGGGFGTGDPRKHAADGDRQGEGGGGGGGVNAVPAGALEITATGTRFIPFHDKRYLAGAFVAGAMFASMLWRRRR